MLRKVLQGLYDGSIVLSRNSNPSDGRNTSLVMLGALVCKTQENTLQNLITVSGISCRLEGKLPAQFIEPLVSSSQVYSALEKNDLEIHRLTDEIKKEPSSKKIQELKKLREKLCDQSLLKVFEQYSFFCADGKSRHLLEILSYEKKKKLPPTGTGDCCAPKLLSFAFEHSLTPLSLAETKIQFTLEEKTAKPDFSFIQNSTSRPLLSLPEKELLPPCDSRCALILPSILGLEILYQDNDIIVVNKQSGVLSVPGRGPEKQDCIVNRVKRLFPQCIAQPAVHRLDMETSGLLVLAFTKEAHRELNRQFEAREVQKKYIALVDGILAKKGIPQSGTMELFFRLDPENRPHQIWDALLGKKAITQWKIENVEYYTAPDNSRRPVTRVSFIPHTGRTHQLRLAAADSHGFGVPIVGDTLYGHCQEGERLLLHASELSFTHPTTKQRLNFTCPPNF